MPAITNRITELIIKQLNGEISTSETEELQVWMNESAENKKTAEEFFNDTSLHTGITEIYQVEASIWKKLSAIIDKDRLDTEQTVTTPVISVFNWKKIAIAASILLIISLGSYFAFFNKKNNAPQIVDQQTKDVKAPSTNRAMITLADGRQIFLDSADNGTLIQQGNVKLVKLNNGQIAYQSANGEIVKEIQYNTLSNPRGSKVIDMVLSDGSHVWLNAGSSITYPIAFVSNERKVTITGEAYFEVTHNDKMPFRVNANGTLIEDLGTEFNVNAFEDEAGVKTTLINGIVRIGSIQLKPGQQAVNDQLKGQVNVDEVTAWKNGLFLFNNTSIDAIMKQVARWYDVDVVYEATITDKLNGTIPRNVSASNLFKILELTGKVHFKIDGRKIIVMK